MNALHAITLTLALIAVGGREDSGQSIGSCDYHFQAACGRFRNSS